MAADKARFFLERSLPGIQDDRDKKKIFSHEETATIVKKRTDFEHRIAATGCKPTDFVRYFQYEEKLEDLRQLRMKRLGIRRKQSRRGLYEGTSKMIHIFNRACQKFPGNMELWEANIEYCRKQGCTKALTKNFTTVLKLHPTNPSLWMYVAKYSFEEHADMTEARTMMLRGIRFCPNSTELWTEYARMEFIYLWKLFARRRILGLDKPRPASYNQLLGGFSHLRDNESNATLSIQTGSHDMILLPDVPIEDEVTESLDKSQKSHLKSLFNSLPSDADVLSVTHQSKTNGVLNGEILITIFDAAVQSVEKLLAVKIAYSLFDMFAECYADTSSPIPRHTSFKIMLHALEHLCKCDELEARKRKWNYDLLLYGEHLEKPGCAPYTVESPEFVRNMRKVLSAIEAKLAESREQAKQLEVCAAAIDTISSLLIKFMTLETSTNSREDPLTPALDVAMVQICVKKLDDWLVRALDCDPTREMADSLHSQVLPYWEIYREQFQEEPKSSAKWTACTVWRKKQ